MDAFGNLNEDDVDYAATIVLEYEGGKRAVLNTHTQLQLYNEAAIYGTKGRIVVKLISFVSTLFRSFLVPWYFFSLRGFHIFVRVYNFRFVILLQALPAITVAW